jgi:hypothetical protein
MRVAKLVLLCLVVLLCGCGKSDKDLEAGSWREVVRWEDNTVKVTQQFTIDSSSMRISWETQPDAEGNKRFRVSVHRAENASLVDKVVHDDGPDKGSKIIRSAGTFYILVDARQPYTLVVEVPE